MSSHLYGRGGGVRGDVEAKRPQQDAEYLLLTLSDQRLEGLDSRASNLRGGVMQKMKQEANSLPEAGIVHISVRRLSNSLLLQFDLWRRRRTTRQDVKQTFSRSSRAKRGRGTNAKKKKRNSLPDRERLMISRDWGKAGLYLFLISVCPCSHPM